MEGGDHSKLREVVIANSTSDTWVGAKAEWKLLFIYDADGACVCGHAIVENCVIENKLNANQLIVGNVCVNQFQEDELAVEGKARSSLRKVRANPTGCKANKALLGLALRLGILSHSEWNWYSKQTQGKGSRTRYAEGGDPAALAFRTKINRLILLGFCADRPKCNCGEYAKPRQNSHNQTYFYSCARWPNGCAFTKTV